MCVIKFLNGGDSSTSCCFSTSSVSAVSLCSYLCQSPHCLITAPLSPINCSKSRMMCSLSSSLLASWPTTTSRTTGQQRHPEQLERNNYDQSNNSYQRFYIILLIKFARAIKIIIL